MKTDQERDSTVSAFWKDGTHRVGGREYNGLIESGYTHSVHMNLNS